MRRGALKWTLLLLTAALSAPGFAETSPASSRHPDWAQEVERGANLYRVSPTLFRSARLRKEDVARLQALGIKTVISFRSFNSDERALRGSGIDLVRVPIDTWSINDDEVRRALGLSYF